MSFEQYPEKVLVAPIKSNRQALLKYLIDVLNIQGAQLKKYHLEFILCYLIPEKSLRLISFVCEGDT